MATIDVKDAAGSTVALEKPLTPGRAAAASSRPIALSTEDLDALVDLLTEIQGLRTDVTTGVATELAAGDNDIGDIGSLGIARAGLSGVTLTSGGVRTLVATGVDGSLFVRTVPLEDIVSGTASNTDGTSTSVIVAAGAGIKQYITRASLSNTHASTGVMVALKSGTTSKWRGYVPPGGREVSFDPPLPPNAANEAWNFDPDSAITTIECSLVGFKSKV